MCHLDLRWDEAAGFSQKQAVTDNSQADTQVLICLWLFLFAAQPKNFSWMG
jgi:hypothetical protein